MQQISLRNTPVRSSLIGFGCVSLTMHDSRNKAVGILNEAYDLGITHFDVARAYGFGQAEGILGEFLAGKRDRVTVTTKFGIAPSAALAKHRRLVSFARKLSHKFSILKKIAGRTTHLAAVQKSFKPSDAAASLDASLRELKTDYLDIFEMHEGTAEDAAHEDLISHLDSEVKRGRIRCYGVGGNYSNLKADVSTYPQAYSVLQFNSTIQDRHLEQLGHKESRGLITFGVMAPGKSLVAAAQADAARAAQMKEAVGADVRSLATVSSLLLQHAARDNPQGITLFATTSIEHLRSNIRPFLQSQASDSQLDAFAQFAREVGDASGTGHQ